MGNTSKVKLFLPTLMYPNFIFLLQQSAGTSPLKIWTSTNALSSMSNCLSQCSPEAPDCGPRETGANSLLQQSPQMGQRSLCPLPDTRMGETPSKSHVCVVPQHPQRHFCLWMDAKLLFLRVYMKRGVLFDYLDDVTVPQNAL